MILKREVAVQKVRRGAASAQACTPCKSEQAKCVYGTVSLMQARCNRSSEASFLSRYMLALCRTTSCIKDEPRKTGVWADKEPSWNKGKQKKEKEIWYFSYNGKLNLLLSWLPIIEAQYKYIFASSSMSCSCTCIIKLAFEICSHKI